MENLSLGYALMSDRRVPSRAKLFTLAFAIAIIAVVLVVELPVEALIAVPLSTSGFTGDMTIDGVEAMAGLIIFSCLLLPFLAPATVVNQIRQERSENPRFQNRSSADG